MLNICLIGHSPQSDNFGVGALTVADIEILREVARGLDLEVRFTLIAWKDPRASYVIGKDITIEHISGKDVLKPNRFWRIIRKADLVVDIGGGDSFADIYGHKRLIQMFLMKYQAHLARRPFVLAPQTMGPFSKRLSTWLARTSLNRSRLVCTRDGLSTNHLREINYRGDIIEACDVALRLPYEPAPKRKKSARMQVGLNVSGLLMNGGYTGENMFGLVVDYPALVRTIITQFQSHHDAPEIILVPHVISHAQPIEDDYRVSVDLAAEFDGVKVAPAFTSPSEAKSFISGLDFFMGARMHSCIAAFSSGVSVVPMAYSRKFSGMFGSLGYDWTVDCTKDNEESIVAKIFKAYEARDAVAKEVGIAFEKGLFQLAVYEEALREVLAEVAAKQRH